MKTIQNLVRFSQFCPTSFSQDFQDLGRPAVQKAAQSKLGKTSLIYFLKLYATIAKHSTNSTKDKASVENEFECMKNKTKASIADFPKRQRLGPFRKTLMSIPFSNVPKIAKGIA